MKPVIKRLLKKVLFCLGVFFLILTVNFVLIRLLPGDPLLHILGENEYTYLLQQRPETLEQLRVQYQLDGSLPAQYLRFLSKAVRLDFGYSYVHGANVTDVVFSRLGWTLLLTLPSIFIAGILGAALGLRAGWKRGLLDKICTPVFVFLNAVPTYCLGILALFYLAFCLGWFPIGGMASSQTAGGARILDILWHMLLPVMLLVLSKTAYNFLIMKNCVSQVCKEDYMLVAQAKGIRPKTLLFKHLLRNALLPYLTHIFMQFGYAMTGVMTLEVVFSWKGMGKLLADSAACKDYPVLQLSFLLLCLCVMVFQMLADLLYTVIDPRIKSEDALL